MPQTPDKSAAIPQLAQAVKICLARPQLLDALAKILADVDLAVKQAGYQCMGGGCCCRFALAGHRLYVSTAELSLLLTKPLVVETPHLMVCPYQIGPTCHAREVRPLGCRTYFCRITTDCCNSLYEEAHQRIRILHDQYNIPYCYVELTQSLHELAANK